MLEAGDYARHRPGLQHLALRMRSRAAGRSNTRLVKGSAEEEVARLKHEPGKDLFIFGSASLIGSLTQQALIDEYRIGLNPLVLGGRTPMFKPSKERMRLQLLEARPMQSGVVLLRYARA